MTNWSAALVVAMAVSGCALEDDTLLEDDVKALTEDNGLSFNGLSFNSVIINGLSFNGLSFNGLSFNGLSFNGLSFNALEIDGRVPTDEEMVQVEILLRYMIECALAPTQSATYTLADGTPVTVSGAFGLAPSWPGGATHDHDRRYVSACLLARANAIGEPVQISMRGPTIATGAAEQSAYPLFEAVYWGDLFSDTPQMKACRGDYLNDSNGRLCADVDELGYADPSACGFDVIGACALNCSGLADDGHYLECNGPDGVSAAGHGVTVYLDDGALTASAGAALPPTDPAQLDCSCYWSDKRGRCLYDPAEACKRECGFSDCMYTSPSASDVCEVACEAGPLGGGSGDGGSDGGATCNGKKKNC